MEKARNLGAREPVRIFAIQEQTQMCIVLYTNDARIPHYRIAVGELVYGDYRLMEYHLNAYIHKIIIGGGYATQDEIDVRLPNLFRYPAQVELERQREVERQKDLALLAAVAEQKRKLEAAKESYDVNMVEALVGWKTWNWDARTGFLLSPTYSLEWYPDKPITAKCTHGEITSNCTCGIYAADERDAASRYNGKVHGRIHGWGRYIRGDKGWRAEFAYPREFHLQTEQADLIDKLRVYHVPIYIAQPLRVYDPTEDGYDGYWNTEENGDSGASEESDSTED